jgi:hypothetical protein
MRTTRNVKIWLVMAVLLSAMAGTSFGEKTIYVDTDATGANDGTSWANAYKFLQDALADADSLPKPLEIRVAQGTYRPDETTLHPNGTGDREATFQLINGVTLKGAYAGASSPDPNDRNPGLYETILTGDLNDDDGPDFPNNGENSYHVVTGSGTDNTAVLDGLTVTSGNANGDYRIYLHEGGGCLNRDGRPTLIDCTLMENRASTYGGGIYNFRCSPTLINCNFIRNRAGDEGGGIRNYYGTPMIISCAFISNSAGGDGGGIAGYGSSKPHLTNCLFIGNSAGKDGGGMSNDFGGNSVVVNCTFVRNSASRKGGGVGNDTNCSPQLTNCILWGNSDSDGIVASAQTYRGTPIVNYSCIQNYNESAGNGNIGEDPLFVDANNGDYHLLPDSPCINAGDPDFVGGPNETDIDGEARVMLGRVDMGADEFNPFLAEFVVVRKERVARTVFEYECEVVLENISRFAVRNVSLEMARASANMTIIDSVVSFADAEIPAGESVRSIDTCTIKVDRAEDLGGAPLAI